MKRFIPIAFPVTVSAIRAFRSRAQIDGTVPPAGEQIARVGFLQPFHRDATMNRYAPNEPASPVPLDVLALLMRSDDKRTSEIVLAMSEMQRATLAVHCFARSHMRVLGLRIARNCSGSALWAVGGSMGRTLFEQIESGEAIDVGPSQHLKKKVTLAKFAA